MNELALWLSCAPGLESLLADEVRRTLAVEPAPGPGGVALHGDARLVARANVELGLASHVLVRVAEVRARGFDELVRKSERLEWAHWLRPDVPRTVLATSRRSRLYHTAAIAERIGGVLDRALGPAPGEPDPVTVVARFSRDVCTLSIDTSGEPLHRRGWRQQTAKAPLREDLARALLVVSGWDPDTPLVDPMMGAGTIVIEAATMARRRAPGLARSFALERTALAESADLAAVRAEARDRIRPSAPSAIIGRDRVEGALTAARGNAQRAGMLDDVRLELADLRECPLPSDLEPGAVVTNPPYGRRVSAAGSRPLVELHEVFGDRVRALGPAWRAALITPHRALARRTGLELRSGAKTDHGGIVVELFVRDPS